MFYATVPVPLDLGSVTLLQPPGEHTVSPTTQLLSCFSQMVSNPPLYGHHTKAKICYLEVKAIGAQRDHLMLKSQSGYPPAASGLWLCWFCLHRVLKSFLIHCHLEDRFPASLDISEALSTMGLFSWLTGVWSRWWLPPLGESYSLTHSPHPHFLLPYSWPASFVYITCLAPVGICGLPLTYHNLLIIWLGPR